MISEIFHCIAHRVEHRSIDNSCVRIEYCKFCVEFSVNEIPKMIKIPMCEADGQNLIFIAGITFAHLNVHFV